MSTRSLRTQFLAPLVLASASALALGAPPAAAGPPPPGVEQHDWDSLGNFVDLFGQVFQAPSNAHPTGTGGGGQSVSQTGAGNGPQQGPPAGASNQPPPQSPGVLPFGGGFSFSMNRGAGSTRSDDRVGGPDKNRAFSDDQKQREWEHQVDAAFPPTPRDPNFSYQPPGQAPPLPSPPPSAPPPPSVQAVDISQAGLIGLLVNFVSGDWGAIAMGSSGGPPPPMVLNSDATFETAVQGVSDVVVPVVGDLGGDVADDIIL